MVLVDTSVWIEVFRRPSRLALASVTDIEEVVTCLPVVQAVHGVTVAHHGRDFGVIAEVSSLHVRNGSVLRAKPP